MAKSTTKGRQPRKKHQGDASQSPSPPNVHDNASSLQSLDIPDGLEAFWHGLVTPVLSASSIHPEPTPKADLVSEEVVVAAADAIIAETRPWQRRRLLQKFDDLAAESKYGRFERGRIAAHFVNEIAKAIDNNNLPLQDEVLDDIYLLASSHLDEERLRNKVWDALLQVQEHAQSTRDLARVKLIESKIEHFEELWESSHAYIQWTSAQLLGQLRKSYSCIYGGFSSEEVEAQAVALQRIRDFFHIYPSKIPAQVAMAFGLLIAMNECEIGVHLSESPVLLNELRALARAYPHAGAPRIALAMGLSKILSNVDADDSLPSYRLMLAEFREVCRAPCSDPYARKHLPIIEGQFDTPTELDPYFNNHLRKSRYDSAMANPESKLRPLKALPSGLTWPKDDYVTSPHFNRKGGFLRYLNEEWKSLIPYIDMPTMRVHYPTTATAIDNNRKALPPELLPRLLAELIDIELSSDLIPAKDAGRLARAQARRRTKLKSAHKPEPS